MLVLVSCKNEEDPIKNEGTRVITSLYVVLSDAQGQPTPQSVVESRRKFELIKGFMVFLITCKDEEDPIKYLGARVLTTFLSL